MDSRCRCLSSLDNLDFVRADYLVETLKLYLSAIEKLEINSTYNSLNPQCEPMLGKRNLYPKFGGHIKQKPLDPDKSNWERDYKISTNDFIGGSELDAIRWLMFYSDGGTSILDISQKTKIPMKLKLRGKELFDVFRRSLYIF